MSVAAVDTASYQVPHRKPVPQRKPPPPSLPLAPSLIVTDPLPIHSQPPLTPTHSRTRTASSSIFPDGAATITSSPSTSPIPPSYVASSVPSRSYPPPPGQSRADSLHQQFASQRTFSAATTSTSSTTSSSVMTNQYPPGAGYLQRSSSNASSITNSPTSYVALMRKQKATVWCERSQSEDPRVAAAQRAAKTRANLEVVGGRYSTSSAGTGDDGSRSLRPPGSGTMSGVRSKIRHHPPKGLLNSSPGNLAGSGVPMRLSASEVGDGDEDDYRNTSFVGSHHRSGSGRSRSSVGSNRRVSGFTGSHVPAPGGRQSDVSQVAQQQQQQHHGPRMSMGSGRSSVQSSSPDETGMVGAQKWHTPARQSSGGRPDYFGGMGGDAGSTSSGDREDSFGNLGTLNEMPRKESESSTADELRRRGSVDERTTTMTGVRLFVANPDLSD